MSNFKQREAAINAADNLVKTDSVEDLIRVAEWILGDESVADYVKEFKSVEPRAGDPVDPKDPAPDWIIKDQDGDYWKIENGVILQTTCYGNWIPLRSLNFLDDTYAPYTYVCPVKGTGIDQIPEGWVFEIEGRNGDKFFWEEGTVFFSWEGVEGPRVDRSGYTDNAPDRSVAKFTILDRNTPRED